MQPLTGKVALVTGAGRGVGAATARLLAQQGARVVLASRTGHQLEAVAAEIESQGGRAFPVSTDVGQEAQVDALFEEIDRRCGRLDILVNNAATISVVPFPQISSAQWRTTLSTNLDGAFYCAQRAFTRMQQGGGGSIVNISSLSGIPKVEKFPGFSAYIASKFGILGLTEALAVEGKPYGIRTNAIAPGAIDTEMLRAAAPHLRTQTKPEDIAEIIAYLCDSRRSGALNGATIEVMSNL